MATIQFHLMGVSSIEYALQAKPAKKPKLMQSSGTSCNCAENAFTQRGNMCEKGCTTCHKVRPLDLGGATEPSLPVTCPLLPVPRSTQQKKHCLILNGNILRFTWTYIHRIYLAMAVLACFKIFFSLPFLLFPLVFAVYSPRCVFRL